MSVNKFVPHLLVIPEDDANRQIANGFLLEASVKTARVQVLEEVGGWHHVIDSFLLNHCVEMQRYEQRHVLLILDFDNDATRLAAIKAQIPPEVTDRVFVLGSLSEPEPLKEDLGSFETIGLLLARDCLNNTNEGWGHRLLAHNAPEVQRLRAQVRTFLF
jgi:hypothetical protein